MLVALIEAQADADDAHAAVLTRILTCRSLPAGVRAELAGLSESLRCSASVRRLLLAMPIGSDGPAAPIPPGRPVALRRVR